LGLRPLCKSQVRKCGHPIAIQSKLAKIGAHPIYDRCGGNVSRFYRKTDLTDAPITMPELS
jgi:hypothetical protein